MSYFESFIEPAINRLGGAYAPNTIRAYYADVGDFVDWCGAGDLRPFPLEDAALIDFVTAQSRHNKYATIRRKLVALRRVNRLLGHSDPAPSEDFAIALRRVRRGQSAAKRQARGINRDLLLRMIDAQPDTVAGTRNRAMLSLGYDFLARRSELASIRTFDVAFLPGGGLRGRIRRGKTDQFGAGRLVYGSRRSEELLRAWLKISPGNYQWLFRPVSPGIDGDRPISGRSVGTVIKKSVVASRGLRPREHEVSGHSLRVGAAQDLLVAGHSLPAIMRAGGWDSTRVVSHYLRLAEHNIWDERAALE